MSKQFRLEDPGEGIHEAEILEVHVGEGDTVQEGDDLFTVETDKASVVIPSPFDGEIDQVKASKGQTVEVGDVLLTYTAAAGGTREAEADTDTEEKGGRDKPPPEQPDESPSGADARQSPSDETEISGKSNGSRQPVEKKKQRKQQDTGTDEEALPSPRKPASPATRRLARKLDVDIDEIKGSGPGGRIESADVRRAAEDEGHNRSGGEESRRFDFDHWGEVETVELSATRRKIAERMETAWRTIPHVMHAIRVDVTRLEALRRKHAERFREDGGKLTITVFALKAIATALKDFPRFNASFDPDSGNLVLKHYCHIGVAIDTDQGLMVPVIRDVDSKSLSRLSQNLSQAAQSARNGGLKPRDMQGGSISLTNPGGLGAAFFTPIINYPEVAIVGLGTVTSAPAPNPEAAIGPAGDRQWLPLIVSFDHRVNDGADAARFAGRIGHLLEAPEDMLLAA